jgi:hypothetical protein
VNAARVSDEYDREEDEHYHEHDSLFVFRQFENPKEAFHFFE